MNKFLIATTLLSSTLLLGCNNSDDDTSSSTTDSDTNINTETGTFVDSVVTGIGYRTETLTGVTNSEGEYSYLPGESVTFFIGNLEFPTTEAKGVVTPLDIADTADASNQSVVNMARLLQTLDQDGDPSNGITINEAANDVAVAVDFTLESSEFETAVESTIENGGQDTTVTALISEEDAIEHLTEQIDEITREAVAGTWNIPFESSEKLLTIVFFDNGTYAHFEIDEEENEDELGMEWGEYSRAINGAITTTQIFDANGSIGLTDFTTESGATLSANIVDDKLVFEGTEEDGFEFTLSFDAATDDGIVGTWLLNDLEEATLIMLVFNADGTYIQGEYNESDEIENQGMEWGQYNYDANSNFTVSEVMFDSNLDYGLSDIVGEAAADTGLTISVDGNTLTLVDSEEEEDVTYTFTRQ